MRLMRSQFNLLILLVALTVGVLGCLVFIVVGNLQQISQEFAPEKPVPSPPARAVAEPSPSPTLAPTATPLPAPTASPTPALTPTLPASEAGCDLPLAGDPQDATSHLQRGYAYVARGAYACAVEDFDAALALDGTRVEAYLARGQALFHLRQWSPALEDFERALALDPNLADAHAWRGTLLSAWGRHGPALEALRRAVALDGADPGKRVSLAGALLRSGSPDEAEIEYTRALMLAPRSVEAYVGRAMARAELGLLDAALADLDNTPRIDPFDPVALNGRAWFYAWYRRDHLYEAQRLAQRAVAEARDDLERARCLSTLGWVYHLQGRPEEAVAALEEAAALATVEGQVVYGEILERLGEVQAARE